ncbi:MAG: tRNA (adenosine(37)-N6)-dimethylallyltransferase MiaA [Clostridia bacterium]|nr:tRNA (adenosine(37)-N6)-dimethylallyltransferase MiaA [Clostridia bacterium]
MEREMNNKPRVLAVVGATASGKTALSISLAQAFGGEVISFDSMQVYRGMDIGTATPTREELAAVPHHFINIKEPWESYSCADFVTMARVEIDALTSRGVLPVLCGGTGLYLDGLLCGGAYESAPPSDAALRERLLTEASEEGGAFRLWERLRQIDPESAAATHPNNIKRVVRALEIYACCGKTKSELDRESRDGELCYDATVIGLQYQNRDLLYARIDHRVEMMMAQGLLDEVRTLEAEGLFARSPTAAQAIGYKELLGYLRGEGSLECAVQDIKLATRHYAKRQMTWFRGRSYVRWIRADGEDGTMRPFGDILSDAIALCRGEVTQ